MFGHNVGMCYLPNENGVRANVHLFGNSGFQVRNSIVENYWSPRLAYLVVNPLKFVRVPPRLKSKAANKGERGFFTKNGSGEDSAFFNELVAKIVLVDANGNCWGFRGDLEYGVGNLTVDAIILFRGHDINAVTQLE
jgi:hypothetical protein